MTEEGKILVAGGPVDRRVKYIIAAMVGFLIGGGLTFGYVFNRIHHTTVTNCQQVEVVKHGLMGIFVEAQVLTESSSATTPAEKVVAARFYRDALGRLKPRRC